jgi:carbon-monoxide dehydrogenase small subunit
MKQQIKMRVNGQAYTFDVEPSETLLEVLRENLKLIKTKEGCGVGECGSCAVIMNKKAVNSCLVLAVDADGKEILTAEGMAEDVEYQPSVTSVPAIAASRQRWRTGRSSI